MSLNLIFKVFFMYQISTLSVQAYMRACTSYTNTYIHTLQEGVGRDSFEHLQNNHGPKFMAHKNTNLRHSASHHSFFERVLFPVSDAQGVYVCMYV
jgi:hypothetical protein